MDDEDAPLPPPTPQEQVETLVGALIAQLLDRGVMTPADLEGIAKRLDWADMSDMADSVRSIPLLDLMCQPEEVRAAFHVIDGGNTDKRAD